MVVVARAPGDFGAALLRVEPGKPTVQLCDRVYRSTTPLVTRDGRVFVERGRAGPQADEELRIDELTLEESTPAGMRVAWRGRGYTAHLAGFREHELIVYHAAPTASTLLAVDLETGRARTLLKGLRHPRDFRVDGDQLVFTQLVERQWSIDRVDLATGALRRLLVSGSQVLAPHPWKGDVAYNDHGLRLIGAGRVEHRPGDDIVVAASGDLAAALHFHGETSDLEVFEGGQVRQIVTPPDSHIQVVGFVK